MGTSLSPEQSADSRSASVGEAVWRVPPLAAPAPNLTTRDAIAESDAVRLFVERARLTRPDLAVDQRQCNASRRYL